MRDKIASKAVIGLLLGGVCVIMLAAPVWSGPYERSLLSMVLLWLGFALSWNLISGYSGYVSFGHTAFFGCGAYAGSIMVNRADVPWPLAALLAGLLTAMLAAPVGYVMLRLRGPFFALGMLGLSEVFRIGASKLTGVTGGGRGLFLDTLGQEWNVYYGFLAVAAIVLLVTRLIDGLPYGLRLRAIRDDEEAAGVLGIMTTPAKVWAYILSAFFPAVLGTIYGQYVSFLEPQSAFNVSFNLTVLLIVVLGGAGTVLGPVFGAIVIGGLRELTWLRFPETHIIFFGLAMVVTVLLWPEGLYPRARALLTRRRSDRPQGDVTAPGESLSKSEIELVVDRSAVKSTSAVPAAGAHALKLEDVHKAFLGREVITGCSFSLRKASITGLIGPNGSGKTTTLNLVTGLFHPDRGRVLFHEEDISSTPPYKVARGGIGRTFQIPRVFGQMTVKENVLVGDPYAKRTATLEERASAVLEFVGLQDSKDARASALSYGQRKLLEIARVLMARPGLILMDEPFAGVNPVIRGRIAELSRRLTEAGVTCLIVGHEMAEMMALCEHMVVMDQGAVLCHGGPEAVRDDPRVVEAYFGRAMELPTGR